jgi:16S rRNA (cytosine967-C5)-methyltransferase
MKDTTDHIRLMALEMVMEIMEDGAYSSGVLRETLSVHQFMDKKDRAFLTRLVQGTIERCLELDYLLNQFSKVKTGKMKPVIRNILRISVYQILYMEQVPDRAACNEAVKMAEKKGFYGLKGFVNGVLRNIARGKESLPYPDEKDFVQYLSVRYSTPSWIVEEWIGAYGKEEAERMISSQYQDRPTVIRRRNGIGERDFLESLSGDLCHVEKGEYLPYEYKLSGYDFLEGMKTFQKGWFLVQDTSSMLAVEAAGIREGMLVLDVCAAPGGKSFLAADLMNGSGTVIARDLTEQKVEKIEENIERLSCRNVEAQCFDALVLDEAMVGKADVVIADLPCSGLGIMGHKNDIKYRVTKEDSKELAKLQKQILSVVWKYVRPGGVLIFSTCTVTAEENEGGRKWILEHTPLAADSLEKYLPEGLRSYESVKDGYLQLRQGIDGTDGFFMARFVRR